MTTQASDGTLTINRQCVRCPRVEMTEVSVEEIMCLAQKSKNKTSIEAGPPVLTIRWEGSDYFTAGFLCDCCKQIVARYLAMVSKKLTHKSALRDHTVDIEAVE